MNRREFLPKALLGALGSALSCQVLARQTNSRRPNIILFFVDDLGWRDLGYAGSRFYETPNLDRAARSGVIFTDAYANAPNCAPTRASLLTGLYPPRTGIYTVNSSERGPAHLRKLVPIPNKTVLAPEFITVAEVLKSAGYRTAHVGKWHLGDDPESGPLAQGFDINIGGNHLGHPPSYFSPYRNPNLKDGPEGEYLTDRLTEEAIGFIRENRDRPFFLYLSHYAVHTPIQPRRDLIPKYRRKPAVDDQNNARYAAMVESVDLSFGCIVSTLRELNLLDNTVIFFWSDNGGMGRVTSNAPLRGAKGELYEGGIRVPLFVYWPGRIKEPFVCHTPVITLDFFPSVLEVAGISRPDSLQLDGVSLLPLLQRSGGWQRDALFWHFPAYLEGNKKIGRIWRTTPAGAIRKDDWKLIEFFEDGRLELYHLKDDIGETRNLASDRPELTTRLHRELKAWREKVNAPVPTVRNPLYDPEKKGK